MNGKFNSCGFCGSNRWGVRSDTELGRGRSIRRNPVWPASPVPPDPGHSSLPDRARCLVHVDEVVKVIRRDLAGEFVMAIVLKTADHHGGCRCPDAAPPVSSLGIISL